MKEEVLHQSECPHCRYQVDAEECHAYQADKTNSGRPEFVEYYYCDDCGNSWVVTYELIDPQGLQKRGSKLFTTYFDEDDNEIIVPH